MGRKRDWKNPQDYEFIKELNPDHLAWEFLRRNPDYKKDWARELPIFLKREKAYRTDPKYKKNPSYMQPIISIDDPMFEVNPFKPDYLFKWGLHGLKNPEQDNPFPLYFERSYRGIQIGSGPDWLAGGGESLRKRRLFLPCLKGGPLWCLT